MMENEAKIFPCTSNFNLKLKKTKTFVIDCFQLFNRPTSEKAKTNKNFAQYAF